LAFATTFAWNLSERGVEMVGALPTGLPPISVPSLAPLLSGQLWASAALLALVGMTETSSISRFVARRTGQRSDPGREAMGQGLANVAVAFVGGLFWHQPPGSKAPDRPDFHRRLGFVRRFRAKRTGNCGSSTPDGTTPMSFSRTATGKLAADGAASYPTPGGPVTPPPKKRGPPS